MNACTILIEDLPPQMDETTLQQVLPPYFNYLAVKVRQPQDLRCPMASAHVILDSLEGAMQVADYLDGTYIMGRKIRYGDAY
ncbi:RNA-binding protein [archaeon]|nr:MAG: RNA-binding protein [archaeon]